MFVGGAFAAGDNVTTSKSYVDAEIAQKQEIIPANSGTTQVITNTGTDGDIGTKDIYNTSNAYAGQNGALIDAATMNAAVQNAIDSEFECVDRDGNNNCLLMNVRGETVNKTKNLLDPSFMDKSTYDTVTVNGKTVNRAKILPTENGKTYTLSADLTYTGTYYYYLIYVKPDGTSSTPSGCPNMWNNYNGEQVGTKNRTCTFTARNNETYVVYFATVASLRTLNLSNYQMEEGSTATPYEPYGNVYMPSGNQ